MGKKARNEAFRPGDSDRLIDTIESLRKVGCAHAVFYCSKAILEGASESICGACTILLIERKILSIRSFILEFYFTQFSI